MGCMCSKGVSPNEYSHKHPKRSSKRWFSSSRRDEAVVDIDNGNNGSTTRLIPEGNEENTAASALTLWDDGDKKDLASEKSDMQVVQAPEKIIGGNGGVHQPGTYKIYSIKYGVDEVQIAGGWPAWLTAVAGEAIKGLLPRKAESFQKMDKIGQGTYSSVYRARDLETGKIVALKKVRFINRDPDSVRFMAREINVLRKLDHPNVMKLEALVTSRMSDNLYLVFEYMEHDLAGLLASPMIEFTESQIKCYMQQLLLGLEHCHKRGVLHRDIKGSNLLIDNNGTLKIGDFGLATPVNNNNNNNNNNNKQPLTSRVVTLWYRPPELLLGATDYGVGVDLWSAGCILAELFAGKPIMPGRTEVEQMHKIFKLCGSPCEEYWRKSKLPHATVFKPKYPYERCLGEIFKEIPPLALKLLDSLLAVEPNNRGTASSALQSEFFTTKPLPCDPSSLPKYPPSKEFDIKLQKDEKRRNKSKARGSESSRKNTREFRAFPAPYSKQLKKHQNPQSSNHKYSPEEDTNGVNNREEYKNQRHNSSKFSNHGNYHQLNNAESSHRMMDRPNLSYKKRENALGKDYAPKNNRIHYSGPLLPPGGNMEEMLKEHEKHIQHAVRRARFDKKYSKMGYDENYENGQRELLLQ